MRRLVATCIVLLLLAPVACHRRAVDPAMVTERLPGAEEFSPELRSKLARAVAAPAGRETIRTHHRRADGTPQFTNRLVLEASPYLQQHAHNPVNWYPWGDEAFARAGAENKPLFVSIGYS